MEYSSIQPAYYTLNIEEFNNLLSIWVDNSQIFARNGSIILAILLIL